MSEAVDTRVVEAKFDSAQFEKGVDRTVKKLDELKKSLNFDESGKSIAELSAKTQTAAEQASSSLEKLEYRVTSFVGMIKQKLLSGIADEIVGVFFKIKNGFNTMVNELGNAQMHRGMQRYTDMLTSVRTIVANGASEDAAYDAIERLNLYADQTSYSIDQLVNLLSQLKTGGATLKDAEKMIEGLSNAAAAAGVNAQRAGTAYYNFAQAYQKGAMLQQDWMSFQNIGMSGIKMNEAILQAAEAVGTLKKSADGTYQTVNKLDKMIKTTGADAKGITAQNMGAKLSSRWFNKQVMEKFTKDMYYFEEIDPEDLKKYTDLEKLIRQGKADAEALDKLLEENGLTRFAYDAFRAGQEARSFTDVLNTLKDVISRGWSTSFELIFGQLSEAKDLFTWFTENEFATAIYNIGEFRNAVLEHWSGSGGRDSLVAALEQIDEIIGQLRLKFALFAGTDGENFKSRTVTWGHTLTKLSNQFLDFTRNVSKWLNESVNGTKRIDRIVQIIETFKNVTYNSFQTIGVVLKGAFAAFKIVFNFAEQMFDRLQPVFEAFGKAIDKIVQPIMNVLQPKINGEDNEAYVALQEALDNILIAAQPLIDVLPDVIDLLAKIGSFFVNLVAGTAVANLQFIADVLGLIIELFGGKSAQKVNGEGVLDPLIKSVDMLKTACTNALDVVKNFFSSLILDLRKIMGLDAEVEVGTKDGGFFENLANFFKTDKFIESIRNWFKELPKKIKSLFVKDGFSKELYNRIATYFSPQAAESYRNSFKGPLAKMWESISGAIKNFIKDIPNRMRKLWNSILDTILGTKTGTYTEITNPRTGETTYIADRVKEGFSLWFDNTVTSIEQWVRTIPSTIRGIWKKIVDFIFGEEVEIDAQDSGGNAIRIKTRVKDGFSLWLFNLTTDAKKWLREDFPTHIKNIWNTIVKAIFGEWEVQEVTNADTKKTEKVYTCVKNGLVQWLGNIPSMIAELFGQGEGGLKEHFLAIWNAVMGFIFGSESDADVVSESQVKNTNGPTTAAQNGFKLWLENLVTQVPGWIQEFRETIRTLWTSFLGGIFGTDEEQSGSADVSTAVDVKETEENLEKKEDDIVAIATGFAERLGEDVAAVFSQIPQFIADKIEFGTELVDTLLGKMQKLLDDMNAPAKAEDIKKSITGFTEAMKTGDTSQLSPLAAKVVEIGLNIKRIVTERIPSILSDAWVIVSGQSGELWKAVQAIFDLPSINDLEAKAAEIGNTISGYIRSIPGYITSAVDSLKDLFTKKDYLQVAYPDGKILDLESAYENAIDGNVKGWSLWDTIEEIGTSIKDAFIALGPDILEGISIGVGWFGEKLSGITDFLKEKPDNEGFVDYIDRMLAAEGDQDKISLWESAKKLGETIKHILVDVIPNFIKEAINDIKAEIPSMLSGLLGGFVGEESEGFIAGLFGGSSGGSEQIEENAKETAEVIRNSSAVISEAAKDAAENVSDALYTLNGETLHFGETILLNDPSNPMNASADKQQKVIEKTLYNRKYLMEELQDELDKLTYNKDPKWFSKNGFDLSTVEGQKKLTERKFELQKQIEELKAIDESVQHVEKDMEGHYIAVYSSMLDGDTNKVTRVIKRRTDAINEIYDAINKRIIDSGRSPYPSTVQREMTDEERARLTALDSMVSEFVEETDEGYYKQVDTAAKKREKASIDVMQVFQSFGNILTTVAESDTVKVVAICLAAMYALSKIRDLLSFADELEAPGYTAKMEAIKIAMLGIFGIIAYISYLSYDTSQAGQERLKQTTDTFDKIGDFILKLADLVKDILVVLALKSGIELAGDVFGKGGVVSTFFKDVLGISVITFGSGLVGGAIENVFDGLGSVVATLGSVFDDFMEGLGPAIEKVTASEPSLNKAIDAVEKIGTLIKAFYDALNVQLVETMTDDGHLKLEIKEMEVGMSVGDLSRPSIFEALLGRMEMFMEIGSALSNFADALYVFDSIEDVNEPMRKIAEATSISDAAGEYSDFYKFLTNIIYTVSEIFKETLGPYGGLEFETKSISAAFSILGDAMSVFSNGIIGLTPESVKAFSDTLDVFNKLAEAFGDVGGAPSTLAKIVVADTSISKFGREIKSFGLSIKGFFHAVNNIEGFDTDDAEKRTNNITEAVVKVANDMAEVVTELNKGTKDFSVLSNLGSQLPELGSYISSFMSTINTDIGETIDLDHIEKISQATASIGLLMRGLGELVGQYTNSGYKNGIDAWMKEFPSLFLSGLSEVLVGDETALFQSGFTGGKNFFEGFKAGLRESLADKGEPLYEKTLNSDLNFLLDFLTKGGPEEFKPVITPVLEISDDFIAKASTMRSMLGFDAITQPEPGMYSFNNTSSQLAEAIVPDELKSIDSNVSAILSSVNDCKMGIQHFNTSLSRTSFVMYGKDFAYAVGPDIDEYLGRQGVYVARNEGSG